MKAHHSIIFAKKILSVSQEEGSCTGHAWNACLSVVVQQFSPYLFTFVGAEFRMSPDSVGDILHIHAMNC